MKVALAGTAITRKGNSYLFLLAQFASQCYTIGYAHLRTQVAYHTHYMVIVGTEVEAAFAALREAASLALKLLEQLLQIAVASGKYAQVAVQRTHIFILM
jgi:hypothetical protein